ncbi:MAG: triple tyrosine motif-containing protein [Chryseolinea sp.]
MRGIPGGSNILNTSLAKSKELKLRHDQNTFSFEFTDLDFISDPQDTRVLYQLENYDNSWRPAEDKRTAYYFDLQPGRYLFRVKAINAEGIEAIKEIAVIIHPPWWKTTWAYIGFAMIAAIAAVGLYLNGVKQLTAKQAEQVRLMVATQEDERKRISRDLHDDVGTKLSALKLSLSSLGEKARNIDNQES